MDLGSARPRLVGVGVGPGDPELVTLKAARVLREADAILVPATEASAEGPGRAELIATAAVPECAARIERVPFSMADRSGVTERRREAWETSADAALAAFARGAKVVAMATIGDPSVFSTFSYLAGSVRSRLPEVEVEVVPGITAMQALAATSTTPLVEGREVLALVPMTAGPETLERALDAADTVVVYKAGRQAGELRAALAARGHDAVVGSDVGMENEQVQALSVVGERLPYMATVLSAPRRTTTGGAL